MAELQILNHTTEFPFSFLPNWIVEEMPGLSWKAKGILLYLANRPDGWEVNHKDLVNRSTEGKTAVQSGINEIKEFGFLDIERVHDDEGQIDHYVWNLELWPEQQAGKWENRPDPDYPHPDNPDPDYPDPDNPLHNKKDVNKKVRTNGSPEGDKSEPDLSFKEKQAYIVKIFEQTESHDENEYWGMAGKWINVYGFKPAYRTVRRLLANGKLEELNDPRGYIVAILEDKQQFKEDYGDDLMDISGPDDLPPHKELAKLNDPIRKQMLHLAFPESEDVEVSYAAYTGKRSHFRG